MGQCTPTLSREILSAEPNLLQEKDHKIKAVVAILNVPAKDQQNISIRLQKYMYIHHHALVYWKFNYTYMCFPL